MRILHILGAWPPDYGGGVTETTYEIAHAQSAAGHQVSVLVGATSQIDPYAVSQRRDAAINVLSFGAPEVFSSDPEGWWLPSKQAGIHETQVRNLIARVVADTSPQVVDYHVNRVLGEEALLELGRLSVPIVASLHDFWLICGRVTHLHAPDESPCTGGALIKCAVCLRAAYGPETLTETLKSTLRLAARDPSPWRKLRRRNQARSLVRAAMARSRHLAEAHAPHVNGPCEPILQGIRHDATVAPVERSAGPLRFGFFGGDQPGKGLRAVLAAAARLRNENLDFEVHVFGSVQDKSDSSFVRRGRFLAADRMAAYQSIDVAIMATEHVEPRGRVSEEAALVGRPSIVANIGGLPETVRDEGGGLVFAFRDLDDLTRQMRRVLTEPGLLQRLNQGVVPPPNLMDALPSIMRVYAQAIDGPGGG